MKRKFNKLRYFFKYVWRNWYYEGIDKWHPFKYRIAISTAWEIAETICECEDLK